MILSGEKKEEYREIKPYWYQRLIRKDEFRSFDSFLELWDYVAVFSSVTEKFDQITFKNGYSKNAPEITIEFKGIEIGNAKPEWSDNWQGEVFIIKLGNILKTSKQ